MGIGGIHAAGSGLRWIGIELEEEFVELAEKSFALHYDTWQRIGRPPPLIVQGDSRELVRIMGEHVRGIVTSPPFQQALKGSGIMNDGFASELRPDLPPDWIAERTYAADLIGDTAGQIGAMKEGELEKVVAGIVTSPPYSEGLGHGGKQVRDIDVEKGLAASALATYGETVGQLGEMPEGDHAEAVQGIVTSPPYMKDVEPHRSVPMEEWRGTKNWGGPNSVVRAQGYPRSDGQLGGMPEGDHAEVVNGVVTSPPYAAAGWKADEDPANPIRREAERRKLYPMRPKVTPGRYSADPGNLGNLPEGSHEAAVQGIVTSPPWECSLSRDTVNKADRVELARARGISNAEHLTPIDLEQAGLRKQEYGESDGQIGAMKEGEHAGDYWGAVAQVYQQCYALLRPGSVMAVVVKSFVCNGQIVDLPSRTLELLEAIGFEPLERVRAWLVVSEYASTLFDDATERGFYELEEKKRRAKYEARASRRLAEGKKTVPYRPYDFDGWLRAWRQKKRASFFRRDHEKKGSPRIDWEEVLFVRK